MSAATSTATGRRPSLLSGRRAWRYGPDGRADVTSVFTFYLIVLMAIPATMIVKPLGSVGAPAMIIAIACFGWWLWHHAHRSAPEAQVASPVRRAALVFLIIMFLVYAHAMTHPLPSDEITPADSGLLRLLGMSGVILVITDGMATAERWITLMRRMVWAGALVSLLAVAQFITGQPLIDHLSIPGLTPPDVSGVAGREGFTRASGTATHPIEFGACLTMFLPIALMNARITKTHKLRAWLAVGLIGFSTLTAISRTAIICLVIGLICLLPSWRARERVFILLAALVFAVGAGLAVPGLLGTLRGMFTNAGNDSSVASRTNSYRVAFNFIGHNPLLGRGYGTFIPRYWILDNLYLQFTIECGILGLLALIALEITAMASAWRAARTFTGHDERLMGMALFASVCSGAASMLFFDAFSFPQSAGCLFLVIGLAGAATRISRTQGAPLVTFPGQVLHD